MVKENKDGSITIGNKTINKQFVDAVISYINKKSNPEKYGKPTNVEYIRYTTLDATLASIPGAFPEFLEWVRSKHKKTEAGSFSVMEMFVIQYGYSDEQVRKLGYHGTLELFFKKILVPQLCKETGMKEPILSFPPHQKLNHDFYGNQAEGNKIVHGEIYGYCTILDTADRSKGTSIALTPFLTNNGIVAEAIVRHELAHHREWTTYGCWGNYRITPSGKWVSQKKGIVNRSTDLHHSGLFYDCSKELGLNLSQSTLNQTLSPEECLEHFINPNITLITRNGKKVVYDRTYFYAKK